MRVLCGVLAALLVLFAAVQANDPDPLFWAAIYAAAADWCALAAFRPALLRTGVPRVLLLLSLGAAAWGVVAFFPRAVGSTSGGPRNRAKREGMGMMVVALAMAAAALVGLRRT